MAKFSGGLGDLMRRPQFAYRGSRSGRYAANLYRPIIFFLASAIVLLNLAYYWRSPLVVGGLAFSIGVYAAIFWRRIRMNQTEEKEFYRPKVQFLRGQLSLVGVTLLIGLLAANGIVNHDLWVLYVLATIIVSEHTSTLYVYGTLLEVLVFYNLALYLGVVFSNDQWLNITDFFQDNSQIGVHILAIWLITFVFDYLVRNIQGRDIAYQQHQQWLSLVAEQWTEAEPPMEQRRALLACAEEFINAQAELWLPKLSSDHLINLNGKTADPFVQKALGAVTPVVQLQNRSKTGNIENVLLCSDPPDHKDVSARILIPIRRLEPEHDLIGILDLSYTGSQPSDFQIERDASRLTDLAKYARLVLISSRRSEQLQLEKKLGMRLAQLLGVEEITEQVVQDVVGEFGFDLATISTVDNNEDLIRCVASKHANWEKAAVHSMLADDVQSRVVREGHVYQNNGPWESWLDKRIWRKYQHAQLCRAWIPIPRPSSTPGQYNALGTIEAGFQHSHRKTVPSDMINVLERYARNVGFALANAQLHERKVHLAHSLTSLQVISQKIQRAVAFYEPHQMIRLIGASAEQLLDADVVMIYKWDQIYKKLSLPYITENAVRGKGNLDINLEKGILARLNQDRRSYFVTDARKDPNLVNYRPDGKLDKRQRTFTQRQNIKSFAGLPLIGKGDNLLGFLCINYLRRHEFYQEERQILELFAQQAAVSLEETNNHQLARTMIISQERSNLAAELHHALSQDLFGLKQYARAAEIHADRNEIDKAVANLKKVSNIASTSLQSLDDMLRTLHEQPNIEIDFVTELQDFIERLSTIYPVQVHYDGFIAENGKAARQVQFYLLRIVYEAVNNALRHAQGKNIYITYHVESNDKAQLTIKDDGLGFDVDQARQKSRFGLSAMDFYAHKLNSQLNVFSEIGHGTKVEVCVNPPAVGEKE